MLSRESLQRVLRLSLCLFVAAGCDSTTIVTDAGDSDPNTVGHLADLARSRSAWAALTEAMGGTYSYAEENCVRSSTDQSRVLIEVDAAVARKVGSMTIARSECAAYVNRYDDFVPRTLPQLYADCEQLVRAQRHELTVTFDDRGILQSCHVTDGGNGGDAGCFDACGSGFYIRELSFGPT